MARYECDVCGFIYDEDKEGIRWDELPEGWLCPVCESDKSMFSMRAAEVKPITVDEQIKEEPLYGYLSEWKKKSDDFEVYMSDIQRISETGKSIYEPMRTQKPVISWDDLLIKGAQINRLPLDKDEPVNTLTVLGPRSKHPLIIETPIYISHMSFGALSKEVKIALSKGSASAKTAICSGEGGILKEEMENAYKYIFEYVPNKYSLTDDNLKNADAIEIKIGQSVKPGMGGHLPADKVTDEIAKIRGKRLGEDIHSPAFFDDIKDKEGLKNKIEWLREKSGGRPIGVKIAAGNIEDDLAVILYAKPDFITIDGRGGATGSAPKFIKDSTSIPTIFALMRAGTFLDDNDAKHISLVITGGLRISSDFAKALALGADAVAIATSAMIAAGCQQYKVCNAGRCPVGIATQDPELRKRLKVDISAKRVENFLKVSTDELKEYARITGYDDVHKLSLKDIETTNSEISDYTDIKHVGGKK